MPGVTEAARVLCFGITVLDRVYELDTLPHGDGKITANGYRESGGGIAGTAAVAVAALGGKGIYCGALGDDPVGHWLRAEMSALGVDVGRAITVPHARTPSSCALVDLRGERCLVVDRGTAIPSIPSGAALAGADAILVDHRFPAEASELLARVSAGIPRVLDGEGGAAEDLRRLAGLVEYPIFSCAGLQVCTGEADPARGLAQVDAPVARAIGVTLGKRGSLWRVGDLLLEVGAPRIEAKDTTGCGDVFHGAFALAVAERQPLEDAISFATAAAALKACHGGGWRGMATRAQVEALSRESCAAARRARTSPEFHQESKP